MTALSEKFNIEPELSTDTTIFNSAKKLPEVRFITDKDNNKLSLNIGGKTFHITPIS